MRWGLCVPGGRAKKAIQSKVQNGGGTRDLSSCFYLPCEPKEGAQPVFEMQFLSVCRGLCAAMEQTELSIRDRARVPMVPAKIQITLLKINQIVNTVLRLIIRGKTECSCN